MPIQYNQRCVIARTLELVGERWTLVIIKELMAGPKKFQDLRHSLEGLGSNILSARLKQMEEEGIVAREIYSQHPLRAQYVLTPRGRALEVVLLSLGRWWIDHMESPIERVHRDCGQPVKVEVRCDTCDTQLAFTDTKVVMKSDFASENAEAEGA